MQIKKEQNINISHIKLLKCRKILHIWKTNWDNYSLVTFLI